MKTVRLFIAIIGFIVAGAQMACGGIDDTSNEDFRIIIVRQETLVDGTHVTSRKVGPIDMNWQTQDTDISGPWLDEQGNVAKFAYGPNSRYGWYSGGTQSDGRCPNSWSSPNYCSVPGIKAFKWLYYPPSTSDGVHDADLYIEWVQAQAVMSYGGFSHCTGLVCGSAPPFNAWFDNSDGTCGPDSVACQETADGATFLSGGKRFRKSVPYNAFGWDAGFLVHTAINLETAVINAVNAAGTTVPAFRANSVQNTLEHELAHVNGNHHNPNGGTTRAPLQFPDRFYDPGTQPTTAEMSAAGSYAP